MVTETDKKAEQLIVGRLRREFPDHRIVEEEGGTGAAAASRYEWHVDPLDGTTNFAHGYPCFAVSIGLLEDGKPLLGIVFSYDDPEPGHQPMIYAYDMALVRAELDALIKGLPPAH